LVYSANNGVFNTLTFNGRATIDLGNNNTPQDGVSLPGGRKIIFLGTGSEQVGRDHSTMAVTATMDTPFSTELTLSHVVRTDYFQYVSSYYEPNDGYVYIFGTGPKPDQSRAVHLARAPAGCVTDRSTWTYYTGDAKATFEIGESNAQPIFTGHEANLGETSVRKIASRYAMAYIDGPPSPIEPTVKRGVYARFSDNIVGSWSDPVRIWAPESIKGLFEGVGYSATMHLAQLPLGQHGNNGVTFDDGLAEPDVTKSSPDEHSVDYGGEYAPEIISSWSSYSGGLTTLTYGLSLWNPYQVDLFQSVLTDTNVPAPRLPTGPEGEEILKNRSFEGPDPLGDWNMSGGPFVIVNQCKGRFLSTYGALGEKTLGSLQQSFVPGPQTKSLCFSIWGGGFNTSQFGGIEPNVSVRLLHNGVIVRESRPKYNNMDPPACTISSQTEGAPVAWDLSEFSGERVTLEIHDNRYDPWGFILVSPFRQGTGISATGDCQ
jgi:Domain of unknown function (DUF4185)